MIKRIERLVTVLIMQSSSNALNQGGTKMKALMLVVAVPLLVL